MREWIARGRDWLRRDALDRELAEELRFHRAQLERDARAAGSSAEEAVYVARRRLGSEQRAMEGARGRWSIPWLERIAGDVLYAVRGLRRTPGFTATVVLTLALGIGANAAMFGVVDRLMLRPFPYLRDPGTVHRVYVRSTGRDGTTTSRTVVPYTRYLDLRRWTTSFAQYAAVTQRPLAIGIGETAREQEVAGVSASFFDLFEMRPALGRFFGASEDVVPRGEPAVVLAYAYWRAAFGGRDVRGRSLQIGNVVYTVVGVAPEGFVGVTTGAPPAAFVPVTTFPRAAGENKVDTYYTAYNWDWTTILVRRRPGVSPAAATADLTHAYALSRASQQEPRATPTPPGQPGPRAVAGAVKLAAGPDAGLESRTLLWVTGVAVVVLLIACANVTNLLFARVLRRRRETALRLALGVGRRRLVAQCLTESLVLAALGCAAGVAVAHVGTAALGSLLVGDGPPLALAADWRTLRLTTLVALACGLAVAIGPALLAARGDLAGALKAGAREGTHQRSRTRSALLVVQGALSVVLLVGAGLFVRSVGRVRAMRLGYDAERVLMVMPEYRGVAMDSAARVAFRRRLLATAQAIPGVQHATRVNSRPFGTNVAGLHVPGIDSVERLGRFNYQLGSADFFQTMGTRIVRGRPFTAQDREGAPLVAVVSESMAATLWPGGDPLGRCIRVGPDTAPCSTVVGVAEDVVQQSLVDDPHLTYYLPVDQRDPAGGNRIFVRVAGGDVAASVERVRRALSRAMPGPGYVTVSPLETVLHEQRRSWTLGATMFVAFGALALLVAAVGLYGVIAYDVAQRTHELGIRIALGARAADVVRLVVGRGVAFAAAGVAIGIGIALVAARWIQPLLFEQPARDPAIYGAVGALIVSVAAVASASPARRATRADPNTVLRSD